jgi:5-methyltetrahydropteroyltriglutamate--homocysteine methyltransferase
MGEAPISPTDRLRTAVLGLPRFGPDRELKFALEARWRGETDDATLLTTAHAIRRRNRALARRAGIDVVPVNDFSLTDHVLDTALAVGALTRPLEGLAGEFALSRGDAEHRPLEMTKWFDTNYHYLVPVIDPDAGFALDAAKALAELAESGAEGEPGRPVILGPFSLLRLSKARDPRLSPVDLLADLVPVYADLLGRLAAAGARAVQLDEPCLVLDLTGAELGAAVRALGDLAAAVPGLPITLATYFGGLGPALKPVLELGLAELHLDLVRDPGQLAAALRAGRAGVSGLSLGVVDGRNVWATDPARVMPLVDAALDALGPGRITLAPSCSLLHVPYSVTRETRLAPEVRRWLAFAAEKLTELATLARAAVAGGPEREALLAPMAAVSASRRASALAHQPEVRARAAAVGPADTMRATPVGERAVVQRAALGLPELPTTTIGSFPQTAEIRAARRRWAAGELSEEDYRRFIADQIRSAIAWQEDAGLDVLVHGEAERNDMVQYFAEQLDGFAVTDHGWVQSYGSRGVKPPILFGDVSRPQPMTVGWWRIAQDATPRPVKGMLTGPVTILRWSFVRDDQPESESARQVALAIRDEVQDLEGAGARIIQIDEAAFREGKPLRASQSEEYLRWATAAFRLCASGVADATQVHSHMCYSEFNEIIEHIAALDADVISIEASRSGMELLDAFRRYDYPAQIGPGVYDIHSPRVPGPEEIEELLRLAEERIPRERLWVNPDCGLKTRRWDEAGPAVEAMVEAARRRRSAVTAGTPR